MSPHYDFDAPRFQKVVIDSCVRMVVTSSSLAGTRSFRFPRPASGVPHHGKFASTYSSS
jgi:hypothetical protein